MNQVEQIVSVEHSSHKALLVVGAACTVFQLVDGPRIRVSPAVEVLLAVGGDGSELCLLSTGCNHELVVEEKRRAALAFSPTLFAVAHQLIDGLGDGVFDLGRLAFYYHHRQTVQEKHYVRYDVVLGAEDTDFELTGGDEAVVIPLFEVDKVNCRAFLASLAVLADAGVLQQQFEEMPVILQQTCAREAGGELLDHFLDLIVFKPGVDDLELLLEHREHYHFGEALAEAVSRLLLLISQIDDLPAEARKLVEERLLDVVALVELDVFGSLVDAHALASSGSDNKGVTRTLPVSRSCMRAVLSNLIFASNRTSEYRRSLALRMVLAI